MGKYYERMKEIRDGLDRELCEATGSDGTSVSVPVDMLDDRDKKEILADRGVEKDVIDGMGSDELDGALKVSSDQNGEDRPVAEEAEVPEEAIKDRGPYVLRVHDEELGMGGFVRSVPDGIETEGIGVLLCNERCDGMELASVDEAEKKVAEICDRWPYNPDTFHIERKDIDDTEEFVWQPVCPKSMVRTQS